MKIRAAMLSLLIACAAAFLTGCGGDKVTRPVSLGLKAGTWQTATAFYGTGNSPCLEDTSIDLEYDVECDSTLTGAGGVVEGCTFTVNGNHVTFHCDNISSEGGCQVHTVVNGTGTFNSTHYELTMTITLTTSGGICSPGGTCTMGGTVVGDYQNSSGCTAAPGWVSPERGLARAVRLPRPRG